MISVTKKDLTILQFTNLNHFPELLHFSTTRIGGCSTDNYSTLNLGFNSGDLPQHVISNRLSLCSALEQNPEKLIFPKQTHSSTVKTITSDFFALDQETRKSYLNNTDALITRLNGVCISIKTADCVPILLFDPDQKVVAAIHAGWRGTAQKIVSKTIYAMAEEFGSKPGDIRAGIGPSISPEVYEVGEEVWRQFDSQFCSANGRPDKRLLDLWKANYSQLVTAGVPDNQIEIAKICTLSDPVHFFSARRDGANTGRMATGIMIK